MNDRKYNKLFVPKNQNSSTEKIYFGYTSDKVENVLKKDNETYFHVPFFASSISLKDSSLISNGATAGYFPAASDRIYKSLKNYGQTTNQGTPSEIANGTWFCSWLRKNDNGVAQWVDRYYFSKNYDLDDLNYSAYSAQDQTKTFVDVPTTLTLEPGVLYKYFHVGEQHAKSLIETFGGKDKQKIVCDLINWQTDSTIVDRSNNQLPIEIRSLVGSNELYGNTNLNQLLENKNYIDFDQNSFTEAKLPWNEKLNLQNEFTTSFWCQNKNWQTVPSCQLAGNFSTQEGFGVFNETLSSYPFFVLPETFYGHLFVVNQNGIPISDKPFTDLSDKYFAQIPNVIAINIDNHIICSSSDDTGLIYKLDHTGHILISTKLCLDANENLLNIFCINDDKILVVTTNNKYTLDQNLKLLSQEAYGVDENSYILLKWNQITSHFDLYALSGVQSAEFLEDNLWSIKKTDQQRLYKNNQIVAEFQTNLDQIEIGPDKNVWIMDQNNSIYVFDPINLKLVKTFTIGTNTPRTNKQFGFILNYNFTTNSYQWKLIVHYSSDFALHIVDLDGNIETFIDTKTVSNISFADALKEDSENFQFLFKGDFTGYKHKQLLLKSFDENYLFFTLNLTVKDFLEEKNNFLIFKAKTKINKLWENDSWHHVAVTYKNKNFTMYIDGIQESNLSFPSFLNLTYDGQLPYLFGSSVGYSENINIEYKKTVQAFNGKIADVKIFDYCLDSFVIDLFLREFFKAADIYWSVAIPETQYIERVDRMFKNRLPGSKSMFYNIKLSGLDVVEEGARKAIEQEIRNICLTVSPAYADLVNIIWV